MRIQRADDLGPPPVPERARRRARVRSAAGRGAPAFAALGVQARMLLDYQVRVRPTRQLRPHRLMRTRADETRTVTCAVTCAMTSTVTCAVTCSNRLGPGVWGCVLANCLPPVPVLEAL